MALRQWYSDQTIKMPGRDNPARREYENRYLARLKEVFGGEAIEMKPVKVPVDATVSSNLPVNRERFKMYRRMYQAGDAPMPVFVRENASNPKLFDIIDGHHRIAAAQEAGLKFVDGYQLLKVQKGQKAPAKSAPRGPSGVKLKKAENEDVEDPAPGHQQLPPHIQAAFDAVRAPDVLTDDLRLGAKRQYGPDAHPLKGHCYIASEALYHLIGGRQTGWIPHCVRHEGDNHWFLKHRATGTILDPTAEQFETPPPYSKARGKGFLTGDRPSKRAQTVMDRAQTTKPSGSRGVFDFRENLSKAGLPESPAMTFRHESSGLSDHYYEPSGKIVALIDGVPVGELHYFHEHRARPDMIHVASVLVSERHRGKGIGTSLLSEVHRFLHKAHPGRFRYATADTTSAGSLNLFTKRFGRPLYVADGVNRLTPEYAASILPKEGYVNERGEIEGAGVSVVYGFSRRARPGVAPKQNPWKPHRDEYIKDIDPQSSPSKKEDPALSKSLRSAAFRNQQSGEVVESGPCHNPEVLPQAANDDAAQWEEGFTTDAGEFLTREEASAHVNAANPELESNDPEAGLSGADLSKAISDIKTGRRIFFNPKSGAAMYDYSHVLSPAARKNYRVILRTQPRLKSLDIHVQPLAGGDPAGQWTGNWDLRDGKVSLSPHNTAVDENHRRNGLGLAMYEAAYAHAKHVLGATHISGGAHSTGVSRLHAKLAEKHGLAYKPKANIGDLYPDKASWSDPDFIGDYDGRFKPYEYVLKGELQPGYEIRHEVSDDGRHAVVSAHQGNEKVGELEIARSEAYPGFIRAVMLEVHPHHRRKGIATAMYQRAEQVLGAKVVPGGYQSPDAKKLWAQKNRPFGADDVVKNEAPTDYVYHLTHANRLASIAEKGLVPNAPRNIGAPSHDAHARGKLFFTDPAGVNFWHSRSRDFAEHNSDHPASEGFVPVVLRTPKHEGLEEDAVGSRDALAPAYHSAQAVAPERIEFWNGSDWRPIHEYESLDHRQAFDFEDDPDGGESLQWFKQSSPLLPDLDNGITKTERLDKGVMHRIAPFNPVKDRLDAKDEAAPPSASVVAHGLEHDLPGTLQAEGYRCHVSHTLGGTLATINRGPRVVGTVLRSGDKVRENWVSHRAGLPEVTRSILQAHDRGIPLSDRWNESEPVAGVLAKADAAPTAAPATPTAHAPQQLPSAPVGSHITSAHKTYEEAAQAKPKAPMGFKAPAGVQDQNLWVRNHPSSSNAGRTLMVQFSSDLLQGGRQRNNADDYYDKLYANRQGYDRPADFWELPQWQAHLANSLPNVDHYTVRNPEEAVQFFKAAGYKNVAFSAVDVAKDFIQNIAQQLPEQKFVVGGYGDLSRFKGHANVAVHNSTKDFVESEGAAYKPGYDYRHFAGTKTIPRLTLSDGCRHQCTFCCVPRKVEEKPREEILQQADAFAKHLPADLVYLNDKTFGQAPNHKMLPELYQRIKAQNPNFKGFIVQTTAAQMKNLTPEFLKAAGIRHVELGVESFNDHILRAHKKPANTQLIQEAADKLRQANINFIPNIMVGLPGEDKESYANTLRFLENNKDIISHANIYNLALYDESELGNKMAANSDADKDENQTTKSWMQDPKVHKDFHQAVFDFGNSALDRVPYATAKSEGSFFLLGTLSA